MGLTMNFRISCSTRINNSSSGQSIKQVLLLYKNRQTYVEHFVPGDANITPRSRCTARKLGIKGLVYILALNRRVGLKLFSGWVVWILGTPYSPRIINLLNLGFPVTPNPPLLGKILKMCNFLLMVRYYYSQLTSKSYCNSLFIILTEVTSLNTTGVLATQNFSNLVITWLLKKNLSKIGAT